MKRSSLQYILQLIYSKKSFEWLGQVLLEWKVAQKRELNVAKHSYSPIDNRQK
jgi:hypothetical protein